MGSPVVVTNSSGDAVKNYHYYPFGKISEETGSLANTHKFTGKELVSETGLGHYYSDARYYGSRDREVHHPRSKSFNFRPRNIRKSSSIK